MEEIILYGPEWLNMADGTRSLVGPGIVAFDSNSRVVGVRALPDTSEPNLVAATQAETSTTLPQAQETSQAEQVVNVTPTPSMGG